MINESRSLVRLLLCCALLAALGSMAVSLKRPPQVPFVFDPSALAGPGFPRGSCKISRSGYRPYLGFPWSREIGHGREMTGLFVEYAGACDHLGPSRLLDTGGTWRFTKTQQLNGHAGIGLLALGEVFAIAFAVGLDVLAISLGAGVAGLTYDARLRVGLAFASSEIAMQIIGYALGAGASHMLGEIAAAAGFALLASIGLLMIRNSFRHSSKAKFDTAKGAGLIMASLSISLDSLGVGIALPALAIPLLPLLITVSFTTALFTLAGLSFGARLGKRYERNAERGAGAILVILAALFAIERLI
jgi:putative Mn2+ efflux pump MntP